MSDRPLTATSEPPAPLHRYRPGTVIAMTAILVIAWFMILALDSSIGAIGLLALIVEFIVALSLDWYGVIQLRGRISRQRLPMPIQVVLAVTAFFFQLLWFIPYLVLVWRDRGSDAHQQEVQRQQEIATLEAQLGIEPAAEGQCPNCHKPLQLGAEFCAYCGTPVTPRPRVCPRCGASTFSDAKFCPECGGPLEAATSR